MITTNTDDCFMLGGLSSEKPAANPGMSTAEGASVVLQLFDKLHASAAGRVIEAVESEFRDKSGFRYKMLEIACPNGSRSVGLPANPDTARGWSANILLDEFALHKDSRAIWTALFPSITRATRSGSSSTFRGKSPSTCSTGGAGASPWRP